MTVGNLIFVILGQTVLSGMQAKLKAPQSDLLYWCHCVFRGRVTSWVNQHTEGRLTLEANYK